MTSKILICPFCAKNLFKSNHTLFCSGCGKSYSIEGDVYCFVDMNEEYYWGEISREKMLEINQYARQYGYSSALEKKLKIFLPSYYESLTNGARTNFFLLLPLSSQTRLLDIGSGWGRLTFPLSDVCGEVFSLELVQERIKFQEIRKMEEKKENITLIRSSFLKMPFPPATFDIVIVNGVLEWVGLADKNLSPEILQKKFLHQVYQILKPGGQLYIGIENRFGAQFLLGRPDHSGRKFTSLMPRKMADLYMFIASFFRSGSYRSEVKIKSYRTYTYGLNGYNNLLKKAGFTKVEFYGLLRSYNDPLFIIPIFAGNKNLSGYLFKEVIPSINPLVYFAKKGAFFINQIGLFNHICPHFGIIAKKEI